MKTFFTELWSTSLAPSHNLSYLTTRSPRVKKKRGKIAESAAYPGRRKEENN
jgi:hypothetical protein